MEQFGRSMDYEFFTRDVVRVSRDLIGVTLLVDGVRGVIVETEAYSAADPASHSFRGRTDRNASMFGPVGRAYVYRSYGIHRCLNFVCDASHPGSALLVRAIEPVVGLDKMESRRGIPDPRMLCAGPGRLTRSLDIDGRLDGAPLDDAPFEMRSRPCDFSVAVSPRIRVSRGTETPWRFFHAGSSILSRTTKV